MKRSKNGKTVHRDDCIRATTAIHWTWANNMSDDELLARIPEFPWLALCRLCFHDITQPTVVVSESTRPEVL